MVRLRAVSSADPGISRVENVVTSAQSAYNYEIT